MQKLRVFLEFRCYIDIAPTHKMAYDILVPLLYSIQNSMELSESQLRFLYTFDLHNRSNIHVNMTSWMLYASKNAFLLLNFLSVDKDLQNRLWKRTETTKQKMVRWLWNKDKGFFDDITKKGDESIHSNNLTFNSMLPFALDVGQIGNIKTDQYLTLLFDPSEVYHFHVFYV